MIHPREKSILKVEYNHGSRKIQWFSEWLEDDKHEGMNRRKMPNLPIW
jgi:hypothetical protein